jgi:hypothetical protein
MWALYAVGIPYIWYTLTRWKAPYGHGLNWKEPTMYSLPFRGTYGGQNFAKHQEDIEWHPDDILRVSTTGRLPYGEPYHVPFNRSWWPRTCDPHVYL